MLKTPTQLTTPIQDGSSSVNNEIKVKTAYNGEVMITYIDENITYEKLCQEIRGICRFSPDQPFTMKWVDDENDPCTISTQMELDEAIRLYELNKDSELVIHDECPFSKTLMGVFYEADTMLREEIPYTFKYLFGKVNCNHEKDLIKRYNIIKYPTIHFFYNGINLNDEYKLDRKSFTLYNYVLKEIKLIDNTVKVFSTLQDLGLHLSTKRRQFLAYFRDSSCLEYQLYKNISMYYAKKCDFIVGFDKSLDQSHPLVKASILFRPNSEITNEIEETFHGDIRNYGQVYDWVHKYCIPIVKEINTNDDMGQLIYDKPVIIYIYKYTTLISKYIDVIENEFSHLKNDVNFLYCSKFLFCSSILEYINRNDKSLPLIIFDTLQELYIYNNFKLYKDGDLIDIYNKFKMGADIKAEGPYRSVFVNYKPSNEEFTLISDT